MSTTTKRYTLDEYYDILSASQTRHEYVDGEIVEMVGGSAAHNQLFFNLTCQLVYHFNRPGYHVSLGNTCIKIPGAERVYFPDAAVVVGTVERAPRQLETILNPKIVLEILSPSTEQFDRGEKFADYQRIPELEYYVLISQDEVLVERFARKPNGEWLPDAVTEREGSIRFETLDWTLNLSELYRGLSPTTTRQGT